MNTKIKSFEIKSFDERRNIVIPGNVDETHIFCVEHFIATANSALSAKGAFYVALSGGSTPKAIFKLLASPLYRDQIDWSHVHLFWSDERCVSEKSPESNFFMAMEAGFSSLNIPKNQIHRMQGDASDLEVSADLYQKLIEKHVPHAEFDLIMLGMGDDGHTASLFPDTKGLHIEDKLVIENFIPKLNAWRLTFSYSLINKAKNIAIYVMGKSKAPVLKQVLKGPFHFVSLPIQKVGTKSHKALWIVEEQAASQLDF